MTRLSHGKGELERELAISRTLGTLKVVMVGASSQAFDRIQT